MLGRWVPKGAWGKLTDVHTIGCCDAALFSHSFKVHLMYNNSHLKADAEQIPDLNRLWQSIILTAAACILSDCIVSCTHFSRILGYSRGLHWSTMRQPLAKNMASFSTCPSFNAGGARVIQIGGGTRDLYYYPKDTILVTAISPKLKKGMHLADSV